jgi:hypothetical protein
MSRARKAIFFPLLIPVFHPSAFIPPPSSFPFESPPLTVFSGNVAGQKNSSSLFLRRNRCALNALWRRAAAFARQPVQQRDRTSPDSYFATPFPAMLYVAIPDALSKVRDASISEL